jgi:hypothetical protein
MFVDQTDLPSRGRDLTNLQRAIEAWGAELPEWVRVLATACDASNQRGVGTLLGKSSGYISRIINNQYRGDLAEAERLVRARLCHEDVHCPIWNSPIPLSSCMRHRRRGRDVPSNTIQQSYLRVCPRCPNNADVASGEEGE